MKCCFVATQAVPIGPVGSGAKAGLYASVCVCVRLLLWCCGSGNHACSMPGLSKNTSESLMQFSEL